MEKVTDKETPLMRQYNHFKAQHPGALLLFRVGDFYETFGQDAVIASKILDITLTKRSNGAAAEMELAGFPHHALDTYLPKLVRAGQRVAICDQLEDPKMAKGIVKRGITEMVTPGVSLHDQTLTGRRNNFLASVCWEKDSLGVAFLDISTGEFAAAQGPVSYIEKLIQGFAPAEIIYPKQHRESYAQLFGDQYHTFRLDDWVYVWSYGYEKLTRHFGTPTLKGFGIEEMPQAITAAGAILHYLDLTEHRQVSHITGISRIEEEQYVWIDKFTIRNLELVEAQHEGGVPLVEILDRCATYMGSRLLRRWLALPLKDRFGIEERLAVVRHLVADEDLRSQISRDLSQIGDLERLNAKLAAGRINPREMLTLRKALLHTAPIRQCLRQTGQDALKRLADRLNPCEALSEEIGRMISDQPPINPTQGGIIREGIHEELDQLRSIAFSGKDFLNQIQEREIARTGISSLKISYNRVFGYYLEVRNTHKDKVPADWIRKQTLTGAERYVTPELKTYEEKILTAEDRSQAIETELYQQLVRRAGEFVAQIQQNAVALAALDCLTSFAEVSDAFRYACPVISEDTRLDIRAGRHPVIERQLAKGEAYVPNDILLGDEQQIIVITGPNMAGKSALLRQTALIVLMAQIGCFVPADSAEIGIVDKIFTRVGASDNLSRGESTFMVEMTETAGILHNLSNRSLVIMDEIGRGTSTYDGISIAWAIVEYLHQHPHCRPKTLFATHYHELNQLAEDFPRIRNFNVSVKEAGNKVIFLRKLQPGGSEHSFGIHVAQMAGMPNPVVLRAHEILQHLEKDKVHTRQPHQQLREMPKVQYQLSLFEADPRWKMIQQTLSQLDINTISPVEALLKLNELKGIAEKGANT